MTESKTSGWLWFVLPIVVLDAVFAAFIVLVIDPERGAGIAMGGMAGMLAAMIAGAIWMRKDTLRMRHERETRE